MDHRSATKARDQPSVVAAVLAHARWLAGVAIVLAVAVRAVSAQAQPPPTRTTQVIHRSYPGLTPGAPAVLMAAGIESLPPPSAPAGPEAVAPGAAIVSPLETERLPPAIPEPANVYPVDLCIVLRLADYRNPTIALARQAIQENLALQQAASVLLLPTLRGGGNYHLHDGNLQRSGGAILSVNQQSLYYGGGAGAVGSTAPTFPAVQIYSHLGDAYYEPLAARQRTQASQFDARATANTQMLEITTFYLHLVAAEAQLAIYHQSIADMQAVVRSTANFAVIGQGRQSDADRALTELRLLESQRMAAEERMAVAAAELSGALNLDPTTRLETLGGPIPIVDLIDKSYDIAQLEAIAVDNRPELTARRWELAMQRTRVRQEQTRPFFPTVSVAFSGGVFGGGSDLTMPFFGRFNGRSDFDVVAYWSAQNLGMGNVALTRNRRALADQAWSARMRTLNLVRNQVADGFALTQARSRELVVARQRLQASERGYEEDLRRIRGGQGLPIELLDSLQRLVRARQRLVDVAIGYDEAQFQLFVALGQPPTVALPAARALCRQGAAAEK